ncbi:hypothetical protein M9H77_20783 [Catharanthus roseus]|uniref:Uncharacterized protein n=1 Tax=Catharanthus roseus TaxID=4058 RepID=A0ACC0AMG7_CATRO|nr:hypothetical protein M9H77_20783 [Catharanthus roseus]
MDSAADNFQNQFKAPKEEENFDYSQRSQWLRAAVLGANDGLVSIASLMMGIGAVKKDAKSMILTGSAGLVAGAASMAIGEFVSVYSQLEIELAQIKRSEKEAKKDNQEEENNNTENENLPSPIKAAGASALAFTFGAIVPLLAAAFIGDHKMRLVAVAAAVTFALVVFGGAGAVLGGAPIMRSCTRVLIGGWMAMAVTFGLTKGISSGGLEL